MPGGIATPAAWKTFPAQPFILLRKMTCLADISAFTSSTDTNQIISFLSQPPRQFSAQKYCQKRTEDVSAYCTVKAMKNGTGVKPLFHSAENIFKHP